MIFNLEKDDFETVHNGRVDDGSGVFGLWVSSTYKFGKRCYEKIEASKIRPLVVHFHFESDRHDFFERPLRARGSEFYSSTRMLHGPWILSRGWLLARRDGVMDYLDLPPLSTTGTDKEFMRILERRAEYINQARELLGFPDRLVIADIPTTT